MADFNENHEVQFVSHFILPERRQRWIEGLANCRTREKTLHRLADARDFMPQFMHAIEPKLQTASMIEAELKKLGAPEQCFVISEYRKIDSTSQPLRIALDSVLGLGLGTVLSCVPGRICFFESEPIRERWILIG